MVNSLESERIAAARGATRNRGATTNPVSIKAVGCLNHLDGRAAVAATGRAGASEPFEAGELQPADAIANAGAASSAETGSGPSFGTAGGTRDPLELEAAEQRRWLMWLGPPFVVEALSVGLVFGTGKEWCLALGVASIFATVLLLIRLILGSDINTLRDSATADVIERAAPVAAATGVVGVPR
jgi:hypothetical protein